MKIHESGQQFTVLDAGSKCGTQTIILAIFFQKLHKIEIILSPATNPPSSSFLESAGTKLQRSVHT